MNYKQLIGKLKPKNNDSFDVNPFEEYKLKTNLLLPNWPDCPLRNWLYRHYTFAIHDYGWLRFDKMIFKTAIWENDKIFNEINSHKLEMIDDLGTQIYSRCTKSRSWLQQYFYEERTWSAPII